MEKEEDIWVSIIIATYNAGSNIKECLLSITTQEFKKIEIIIIDGASTDNTTEIIKSFNAKNIFSVSEPDNGIFDAMNKGIEKARGKWLYFMGSDDRLLAGFSELATQLINEDTVYYGNSKGYYETVDPGYIILTGKFSKYRLAKYCINHQAIIYPAKIFKKYRYNLQYKVLADYALNIQVWGDNSFKKKFLPITIVRYNMNGTSSVNKDLLFKKEKPKLIRQYMGWHIYLRFLYKRYKKMIKGEKRFE
jgi:glycosyltransferase involved in cell wall biosynthesis